MANPITEPEVTKFSNEQERPNAELFFGLYTLLTAMDLQWNSVIAPLLIPFANDDFVDDGRELEGVNQLTKNDLTLFQVQVQALLAQLNAMGVLDIIQKPTVRPLSSII